MILLRLFFEFFKIGLFSVGGGMATLPFLFDLADKTGWYSSGQIADMIAVAESTPGPIGINMATYVGYTVSGTLGGIVATIGLITPSIFIILIIATLLTEFRNNRFVVSVFRFLRPASLGLISVACYSVAYASFVIEGERLMPNVKSIIFGVILFIIMYFVPALKKLHPIVWIGISAIIGALIF